MNEKLENAADKGVEDPEAEGAEEFTDADAEAAFAIGLGEPASETPEGTTDQDAAPEGSETTGKTGQPGEASPAEKADKTEIPGDDKGKGDLPPKPSYEDLEKQLNDTKAWATGLAQTNAELKKKVEAKPPDKPAEPEPKKEIDIPEDIQQYLSDYPEARKAIDFFAEQLLKKTLGDLKPAEISQTISGLKDQISQANFEKSVVTGFVSPDGKWIDGHPDAYKVMATEDYGNWFRGELVRDPSLGNISDPAGAIDVITRYKKSKAQAAAAAHDASDQNLEKDIKDIAAGAVQPGTHQGPENKAKKDEDKSPEEIFDEHAT